MVKFLLGFILIFSLLHAQDLEFSEGEDLIENKLTLKIKSFLDEATYRENSEFINVIFDPESAFYQNQRINSVKVVQTLKENGLLKLFFTNPRELKLNFKTSGTPLFFVKIMGDTLRNIGYYRYVTIASNLDASEFTWNISLTSEYATDPLVLEQELQKSGCKIIDIERNSPYEWTYVIDMDRGYLDIAVITSREDIRLKRSLYAHWLNVSKIKTLNISSSRRNSWYPYISYYDASLHLLKVIREDEIYHSIRLDIPQNAKYMKIADLYTMKNIRDELKLQAQGIK
ncbi:MAG: hypothetical protein SPLUMA2_SPLUMAMAG2_00689 [uncultured Sulfurimonas sp.]|nr:MAG: hypothetical protein SPLUMA1_SPLUMAMAG1_00547 [uncultured Sulfurimonas sp.]CAI6157503.1 MAG: hypothetical protein SPLUMA2_SPLUMAMAG2_00689 [uncultured Sulfurimonas sp.]